MSRPKFEPGSHRDLSVLPVFFRLNGRRCIVIGNTPAAARKAEMLAAAGAKVAVYADAPSAELQALTSNRKFSSRINLHRTPWTSDDFAGSALVIADAETETSARKIFEFARDARTPVNIVDRPQWCDFQFGAIVNRSPVVISISTDGAAPILGQSIRREIEILLPQSLAAWGRIAKNIRERIGALLPERSERIDFWRCFAKRAMSGHSPASHTEAQFLSQTHLSGFPSDKPPVNPVFVVTLASNDPDLLTQRDLRALMRADIIFHEKSVAPAIFDLGRKDAARISLDPDADYGAQIADAVRTTPEGDGLAVLLKSRAPEKVLSDDGFIN